MKRLLLSALVALACRSSEPLGAGVARDDGGIDQRLAEDVRESPPDLRDTSAGLAEGGSDGGCAYPAHWVYVAPGCGQDARPMCIQLQGLGPAIEIPYCACDGQTVSGGTGWAGYPYRHTGRCRDAGAPDRASDTVAGAQNLRGHAFTGFEVFAFRTCDNPEAMWMDPVTGARGWPMLDQALVADPACAGRDGGGFPCLRTAYVELKGVVSPPGRYGHLGGYARQIRVEEVSRASTTSPSDCPRPR